jgi:hypothetical protein
MTVGHFVISGCLGSTYLIARVLLSCTILLTLFIHSSDTDLPAHRNAVNDVNSLDAVVRGCRQDIDYDYVGGINNSSSSITVKYSWEYLTAGSYLPALNFSVQHVGQFAQSNHRCSEKVLSHLSRVNLVVEDVIATDCNSLKDTSPPYFSPSRPFSFWPHNDSILDMMRNKHFLFLGDSIMSGIYRTLKQMLSSQCNATRSKLGETKDRRGDEIFLCDELNSSVSYFRSNRLGDKEISPNLLYHVTTSNFSLDEANSLYEHITHVLVENMVWYYTSKSHANYFDAKKLKLFKSNIDSHIPWADVIFIKSPGMYCLTCRRTEGDSAVHLPSTTFSYAAWRVNLAVSQFATLHGYRVIDTQSLLREMYGHVIHLYEKQPPLSIMYIDSFHPCVPSVTMPWITILLASISDR